MTGIVIPAYGRPECLREALQSLVTQTKKDFIVVVVDDHSPEPVVEVVKEFSDKMDIYYHYCEKNGGPGVARQIGLNTCYANSCEYVMFLDADDMLYPHAVQRLTHEIENTGCDVISSEIWQESPEGIGAKIEANNETWMHGKIYRTKYLQDNDISFPVMRTNEDMAFNLIALQGAEKKGFLNEVLYLFRCEPNSITRKKDAHLGVVSVDYITGLFYTAQYLKEKLGYIPSQIVINTFACYNFYQVGVCAGIVTDEIKDRLYYLISQQEFQTALNNTADMEALQTIVNQFYVFKGQVFHFTQTFTDWLEEIKAHGNRNN